MKITPRTSTSIVIEPTDFLIYVLYHDDYSKAYAQLHYSKYAWAKLTFVETQNYFESKFIANVLPTLSDEWEDKKYIGVMSWKANQKVPIHEDLINYRISLDADIIPFGICKPPSPQSKVVDWAQTCHPNFEFLWSSMCMHLGYTEDQYLSQEIPAFYYNYWIMKKELLPEYLAHLKCAYDYLETEPSIQEKLNEDSKFALDAPRPNMPYLTHHCFLLERLPCIFAWTRNWTIMPTNITL